MNLVGWSKESIDLQIFEICDVLDLIFIQTGRRFRKLTLKKHRYECIYFSVAFPYRTHKSLSLNTELTLANLTNYRTHIMTANFVNYFCGISKILSFRRQIVTLLRKNSKLFLYWIKAFKQATYTDDSQNRILSHFCHTICLIYYEIDVALC